MGLCGTHSMGHHMTHRPQDGILYMNKYVLAGVPQGVILHHVANQCMVICLKDLIIRCDTVYAGTPKGYSVVQLYCHTALLVQCTAS